MKSCVFIPGLQLTKVIIGTLFGSTYSFPALFFLGKYVIRQSFPLLFTISYHYRVGELGRNQCGIPYILLTPQGFLKQGTVEGLRS